VKGQPGGFRAAIPHRARAIFNFTSVDYRYGGNWFLYYRLWETSVEWAIRMGAKEIQSAQTMYIPRFGLGLHPVPLTNYCEHRNLFVNAILRWIARQITWSMLDDDLQIYIEAHPQSALAQFGGSRPEKPASKGKTTP
jgi:hypothetical protein